MPASSDTTLQNLIDAARAGDPLAKTALIDHASDRLLRLTRKMFHSFPQLRRWEQTDDVFTKSLLRLHRALENVEVVSVHDFFRLAARRIRYELLDLKKHYYGPEGEAKNHHTDHQPSDDAGGSIDRGLGEPENLDDWSAFHETIERLDDEGREMFDLLFYEKLSQEDAAQVLGVSVRTVKRRWQEAKRRLAEALRDTTG